MNIEIGVKNKRIILMGSCGVLGKMHAKILCENGAKLVMADRPGSSVLSDAKILGAEAVEIDVSIESSIIEGIENASKFYNGFDGAIYNAAVTSEALSNSGNPFPTFEDYPLNLWQKAIDINLTGAFLFAREIGKQFKLGKAGSLINISSIYGVVGPDHRIYEGQSFSSFPAYSASKAGIIGLSKWLATWWAKDKIRVNCVTPGGVYNSHNDTFTNAYGNRTPMGRMANSDEITGAIIYLLSDSSKYCTGQNIIVDGGLTCW